MNFLAGAFAALKGAAFVSKLAPVLAFIPGGQIVSGVGAVLSFIGTLITWIWKGVTDCFTHPATFLVCGLFAIGGAWGQAKWIGHRVHEAQAQVREFKQERVNAERIAEQRKQMALEAGKRAEVAEQEKIAAERKARELEERAKAEAERRAADAAAAARRVRPAARPAAPGGQGLWSFPALFK